MGNNRTAGALFGGDVEFEVIRAACDRGAFRSSGERLVLVRELVLDAAFDFAGFDVVRSSSPLAFTQQTNVTL